MRSKKKIGQIILNGVFLALMYIYIMPILTLVSSSFTDETALIQNGYSILPSEFSLKAYETALRNPIQMIRAYGVTILVCAVSTAMSTLIMALLAYPLSRSNFLWKRQLNFMVYFTMLFNGGMVPTYLLISNVLKINNTIWALILPGLVSGYYVMVIRTSYASLPNELIEAAKMDGAKELFICFKIVMPLNKASLASVAFLFLVARWNNWESTMLYIRNPNLYSLQYLVQKLLREVDALKNFADVGMVTAGEVIPSETLRIAVAVLAAAPVLCIFPFFQKYFTKGMTIGGVKG